jgi:RND family efflux transporter MFP subunit
MLKSSFAAVLGISLAASLTGCSRSEAQDPRLEPPLVSIAVAQPDAGWQRAFTGIVTARVQSDLGFRVPGKVTQRLVDVGQTVRRGQRLMLLDATDLGLAVVAQAGVVEAARARSVQATADEIRLRGLVVNGAVSRMEYDQAKAAADAAAAELDAAQAQARTTRNSSDYSTLVADVDGVVVDTLAEPGQVVTAGQVVVKLASAGPREATVNLPEAVRPEIGSMATARLYGNSGAASPARLRQLSQAADQNTRTFEARFVLEGEAAHAPLGSTVTVQLAGIGATAQAVVPLGALYDQGKGPGVWVLDPKASVIAYRPVQIARLGDEFAVLNAGLTPGEQVVALGAHVLHEGVRVRATPARIVTP